MTDARRILVKIVLLCAAAPAALPAAAQEPEAAQLTATAAWDTDGFVSGRTPLELALSRPVDPATERIALVIAHLDVSAFADVRGRRIHYRPVAARLQAGDSEVVVYRVLRDGAWEEIGRAPLHVYTRAGFEAGGIAPSLDLSSAGQLDRSVAAGQPPPDRRTYQDVMLRLGVQADAARAGWQMNGQANALGATQETQRLRFGEMEDDAPALDLSDYQLRIQRGRAQLAVGNVSVGDDQYLLSNYGSRGLTASFGIAEFATLDAGLVNGTNVVGWTNLLGLSQTDHRIGSAALRLELVPERPGAARLSFSGLDASVLPRDGFNQSAATDAEESRGFGMRVALSSTGQRIRFTGGLARSRFTNPNDPLLAGGNELVAVRPTTRTARFGELNVQLLDGSALSESVMARLGATLRHERVDPLYRSVGAYVRSDVENNGVDVNGMVGPLSFQGSFSSARDNVGDLASVLTARTRNVGVNAALPVGPLLGAGPDVWYLPSLDWSWQRVRQYGEGVPENGDFSASHIPDQSSTTQAAGLSWSRSIWSFGYRWHTSFQDNRQTGREQADFRATTHALSLGVMTSTRLSTNLDLSVERQKDIETGNTQRLERLGGSARWQVTNTTDVAATLSQAWGFDPFAEQRTRNTEVQLELSQGFSLWGASAAGTQGRVFVRYARTRAAFLPVDPTSFLDPFITWTLNAGGSFRLF